MRRANISAALKAGGQGLDSFSNALSQIGKEEEEARLRKLQEELLGLNLNRAKLEAEEAPLEAAERAAVRAQEGVKREAGTQAGLLSERILGGENAFDLGSRREPSKLPGMEIAVPQTMEGKGSQFNPKIEELLARQATKAAQARGESKVFTPEEFRMKREADEITAQLGPLQLRKTKADVAKAEREARGTTAKTDWQIKQDASGGFVRIDPASGRSEPVIGFDGKQLAGQTSGKKTAKPAKTPEEIQDNANVVLGVIDQMVGSGERGKPGYVPPHRGFTSSVGRKGAGSLFGLMDEPAAGTPSADFNALLGQVQGAAFLEAFESLKGGGAITQVEGNKATQAITRMNTAQSEPEFMKAAEEFRGIVRRAAQRAGGGSSVDDAFNSVYGDDVDSFFDSYKSGGLGGNRP